MRTAISLVLFAAYLTISEQVMANWQDKIWLGIAPGSDAVTLRVYSSGCTKKEDFEFNLGDDAVVSVRRIRPDRCRAKPQLIDIVYSFSELALPESETGRDRSEASMFFALDPGHAQDE